MGTTNCCSHVFKDDRKLFKLQAIRLLVALLQLLLQLLLLLLCTVRLLLTTRAPATGTTRTFLLLMLLPV